MILKNAKFIVFNNKKIKKKTMKAWLCLEGLCRKQREVDLQNNFVESNISWQYTFVVSIVNWQNNFVVSNVIIEMILLYQTLADKIILFCIKQYYLNKFAVWDAIIQTISYQKLAGSIILKYKMLFSKSFCSIKR
jgi:hypothetical protein